MEIIEFLVGIILGILTGLIPGLHPNTIASVLSQLSFSNDAKAALLMGIFPSNIIASFIPAIFFGIPEQETVLCALAGQRLALDGRGITALKVVLISAVIAAFASFILFIPSMDIFPVAYAAIADYVKYIVLVLAAVLIAKSKNPLPALFVFLAAGLLGCYSLNSDIYDPFMPLFSGMFAISMLLNITKTAVPKQKKEESVGKEILLYSLLGVALGMAADLLPGISSPAQVALFASLLIPLGSLSYLATISAVGVSEALFSLSTYVSIEKSRVGTTAWLSGFTDIGENAFLLAALFLFGIVLAAAVVYMLRGRIAGAAMLNSKPIAYFLIAYLAVICFLLDGWVGLVILALASLLGWLTVRLEIERVHLMGAILVPTLLLLFGILLF